MNSKLHRLGAVVVFLVSFGVFFKTAAPTVSFWDCGEFIACSFIMGVPHPPGSPLYLILGRLFTFLPLGEDPAFPVNLMSVISSALAVLFVYLITVRLMLLGRQDAVDDVEEKGIWPDVSLLVGGVTAALMLAFSDTFWFNAVEAEVYGFSIMLMTLAVWMGLVWMERCHRPGSERILFGVAYLMGLAGGLHLLCLLTVPTLLILIWFQDRELLKDPRVWGLALLLFGLGYSTYITLYIRSGLNPIIDENDPENWKNFMLFLKREQYGSESMMLGIFERKAAFWDYQLWTMYFKYFFGQFPVPGLRFVSDAFRKATGPEVFSVQVSVVPYLLGAWGIWTHWRQDVRRFWAMVLLFVLTGIGLCVYLNMPDPQPRERDYVFVGSFAVFAVWIGMAAGDLVKHLSALNKTVVAGIAAVLFLVMPGGLAVAHYPTHDRTGDYIAYDYAFNTLMSCDRNAILFTNGDNDTFPLWFMQEVMAVRKDVRVVNLSLLNTGWYIKQLRDQVPHLPVEYTDTYIDDMLTAYTRTAIIQSGRYWPEDREVQAAGISWLIPGAPAKLLRVQDVMVLKLIDWNAWQRPVYFSITVPESNQLHLGDHLAMEGMVFRLVAGKAQVIHSDVTRKFVMETYRYRGIADPDFYRSETANNLVSNYLACFLQLAEADVAEGRMEAAYKVARYCEEVAVAPENWQGYMLLAGLMHRMDRPDEVQRLVRRVRTSSVLDQETRLGVVGEGQMQFAQYDSAVVVYTEMIQEKINIEVALYNRGVSLEKLGRLEDALQDMQTLSQRSPGDAEVEKAIEFIRAKIQYRDQMESNK